MISFRAIASSSQAPSQTADRSPDMPRAGYQDQQGPLDGELLDLYAAILIVVPLAWFLRSLWS